MTSITQSGNTYCISLLSLACGALFYWINGYQTFNSDLYNYLPFVFSYQNSDLYPFDYFFTQGSSSASLWVPLVGELSEYFRIENLFFYSHVITTTLTFFCIGLISRLFLHQKMAVALVMVSFIPVIPILGSGLVTIDTYFNMRSVAIPLGLLGLYFFLQERLGLAVLFSGVAFLFHPLVSLPLFALIGLYLLHQVFRGHWKASLVSLTGLAAFTVPLLISLISSDSESYSPLSQAPSFWLEIVKERSPYVFLSL